MYVLNMLKNYLKISLQLSRNRYQNFSSRTQNETNTFLLFSIDLELLPKKVYHRKSNNYKEFIIYYDSLINLLDRYDLKGTFFVNGEICIKHPELIKDLYNAEHEIGSHGFYHESFVNLWPITVNSIPKFSSLDRRAYNVRMSKRVICNVIGRNPVCFRAPYLAIDGKTLKILQDEGFLLDSSLYNSVFGRLSYPYQPSDDDPSTEGKINLWEVPITVSPVPRKKFVYCRYPGIFELEEKEIEKSVYLLKRIFLQSGLPYALFITVIHLDELRSPRIVSRISYFLELMKDMDAISLTATQLIREHEMINIR